METEELAEIEELRDELICKGGPKIGQPKVSADPVKLERLRELLDMKAAEEDMPPVPETDDDDSNEPDKETPITPFQPRQVPMTDEEDEEVEVLTESEAEKRAVEREIRRYIKRSGGFRKGLSKAGKMEAKRLLKIAGRKELKWDLDIVVPGIPG